MGCMPIQPVTHHSLVLKHIIQGPINYLVSTCSCSVAIISPCRVTHQNCCCLQASVSESVRQALHRQKAACQAAAHVAAAEVVPAEVSASAQPRQQQAGSCAGQQAGSATQPHSCTHGNSSDQALVTATTSAAAAGPLLDSASDVGQTALAAKLPLPSCHQHLLETEEAAGEFSQPGNSHNGLVEPDMQILLASLPVESAGSQAMSSLSPQQPHEKKSKAKPSGDARPQLWQVTILSASSPWLS